MLEKLMLKIFLLIGRGIVKAVKNETKMMKIQITGLKGETGTDIEYPQNYGFASWPDKANDLESILAFIGGNRDQGIALIIHDRTFRPTLENGDTIVYAKDKCKIVLKTNETIKASNASGYYELKANGDLELLGNARNFVTHAELDTALQSLVSLLNVPLVVTGTLPPGPVAAFANFPVAPSIDISLAKTNKVKTA